MADKKKLTQAELLELLSPPPFNQKQGLPAMRAAGEFQMSFPCRFRDPTPLRKCVPPDAVIQTSPEERWWRFG